MLLRKGLRIGKTRRLFKFGVLFAIVFLFLGSQSSLLAQTSFGPSDKTENPDSAQLNNEQGLVHLRAGEFVDASEHFQRAIELQPEFAAAYENLGATFNALDRPSNAVDALQRALRLNPDPGIYCHLGMAYRKLHRFSAAVNAYQQALTVRPDLAEAYNGLGLAYRGLRKHHQAVAALTRAVQIDPTYANAYNNLGVEETDLRNFQKALDSFEKALAIDSDFAAVRFNLGAMHLRMKNPKAALREWQILKSLDRDLAKQLYAGIYKGKILNVTEQ